MMVVRMLLKSCAMPPAIWPESFHLLRLQQLRMGALERLGRLAMFGHFAPQPRIRFLQFRRARLDVLLEFIARSAQDLLGAFPFGDVGRDAADGVGLAVGPAQGKARGKISVQPIRLRRDLLELQRARAGQGRQIVSAIIVGKLGAEKVRGTSCPMSLSRFTANNLSNWRFTSRNRLSRSFMKTTEEVLSRMA